MHARLGCLPVINGRVMSANTYLSKQRGVMADEPLLLMMDDAAPTWESPKDKLSKPSAEVHPAHLKHIVPLFGHVAPNSDKSIDEFETEETGLVLRPDAPEFGVSPDVLCRWKDYFFLGEIKCPWSDEFYPSVPPHYMAQMQGIMWFMNLPFCDFIVYTSTHIMVKRIAKDPTFELEDVPKLKHFYWNEYVPRVLMKEDGLLSAGELNVSA
jgi:hypothetical protein